MLRFAIVLLACGALFGTVLSDTPVQAANIANTTATASEVTLLFHGSVQGEIIDCGCRSKPLGGLARRAALIETVREDCGPKDCCLLIDAGCLLGKTSEKGVTQTAFLVEETARLGYAAVGVGAWDLRHGLDQLRSAQSKGIPYTNANLVDAKNGELAFTPYRIREVNGVRIGMISVASEAGLSGIDLGDLEIRDPHEALQRTLPELREQCDLVVLMGQMKTQELRELVLDLQDSPQTAVEIAVEGTGSRKYARPSQVGDTWLLAANNRGKVLGQARLIVADDGELLDLDLEIRELSLDLPEDPELAERVQRFQERELEVAGTR